MRNLKKQLECSICLNTCNDPKTISCLHTFCCQCLENHARASHRQGKFRCPECQAQIALPEGNRFDSLPTSFFHNTLLSLLAVRQSGDGSSISCGNCKKRSSDVHYCFDCARFMCPDCLNAHEVMRDAFEGHKVVPVKEFQTEDYETLLKRKPFCSEQYHEREITFFCLPCQSCVCRACIVTDHGEHKVILLDKAADNEKGNIMAEAAATRENERTLKDVIRKFEVTISKLETNVAIAKRGISQSAETMISKIRECEREAIDSVETTRATRLEKINSAREKAESLLKQMVQAVEFTQNLVQRSSSSHIMQNKATLKHRFQELRDIEMPKHHETSFIKFTAASVQGLRLGDITTVGDDVSQCTLEGLDQILQAGVAAEFLLCLRTPEGEINNQPGLKIQIQVLIEPTEDVTNVTVNKDAENGKFKVKFTPKVPGAYNIEVKINDDKLPNCPFTTQVKQRELVEVGELKLKFFQGDQLHEPVGIAVNTTGKIAITDGIGHCVYIFDKEGNCLRKIGSYGKNAGQFQQPSGVTYLNDNEILIADQRNHRIQQVNVQTGTAVKSFGKYGAAKGEFSNPIDVCQDEQHRIVVTECNNHRIQVITQEGATITMFGDSGPEKFSYPTSCIPYKNMFLVADEDNNCIKVFDRSGTFLYKFGKKGNQDGQLRLPFDMLLDSSNNLLVCDYWNNRVQQFSLDGRFTGKTITDLPYPVGIATAPDGRILVTYGSAKKVYILK